MSVEHSFDENWGFAVNLPFVDRTHLHIANDAGTKPTLERWDFSRLGDARVIGRYQFSLELTRFSGRLGTWVVET